MDFFNIIKSIYKKEMIDEKIDNGLNITLNKWLSYDRTNLLAIKKTLPYLFHIDPLHYYYLLALNVVYREKPPFLKKVVIQKEESDSLYDKIKYVMGWSSRELKRNIAILKKLLDEKEWKKKLGVK